MSTTDDSPVYLAFPTNIEPTELYRLNNAFLPLGKIGGFPSWLNPVNIPKSDELACKVCSSPMCFLLQIYATNQDIDGDHSFHRTLFVFICPNAECSKPNDASNVCVFRCGLPRDNVFYPFDGPPDPSPSEIPPPPPDAPPLCRICGCFAAHRCAKCKEAAYCSRAHQSLDWTVGHRQQCGRVVVVDDQPPPNPRNPFLFTEMGVEMDVEDVPSDLLEDISDEDSEGEEDLDEKKRRMTDYVKYVKNNTVDETIASEDIEANEEKDTAFERFSALIGQNPTQILRYQRGGAPLIPTDRAPVLPTIPPCSLCSSPRQFECQLTPHLLSLLGVDTVGHSIDWAAVHVFTCSANCPIPNNGYQKEHVVKQDFE